MSPDETESRGVDDNELELNTARDAKKSLAKHTHMTQLNALLLRSDCWRTPVLCRLAMTKGLVSTETRKVAWPRVVGIHEIDKSRFRNAVDLNKKTPHKDAPVVDADCARSCWAFTSSWSDEDREELRVKLKRVINAVVNVHNVQTQTQEQTRERDAKDDNGDDDASKKKTKRRSSNASKEKETENNQHHYQLIHYYQGFHDVCSVLLLVLGESRACAVAERVALFHVRDATRPDLSGYLDSLQMLPALLKRIDRELHDCVFGESPPDGFGNAINTFLFGEDEKTKNDDATRAGLRTCVFALAWGLAWHAHGLGELCGGVLIAPKPATSGDGEETEKSAEHKPRREVGDGEGTAEKTEENKPRDETEKSAEKSTDESATKNSAANKKRDPKKPSDLSETTDTGCAKSSADKTETSEKSEARRKTEQEIALKNHETSKLADAFRLQCASRLLDVFLCAHPSLPIYVGVVAMVKNRDYLLTVQDPDEMHRALSKMKVVPYVVFSELFSMDGNKNKKENSLADDCLVIQQKQDAAFEELEARIATALSLAKRYPVETLFDEVFTPTKGTKNTPRRISRCMDKQSEVIVPMGKQSRAAFEPYRNFPYPWHTQNADVAKRYRKSPVPETVAWEAAYGQTVTKGSYEQTVTRHPWVRKTRAVETALRCRNALRKVRDDAVPTVFGLVAFYFVFFDFVAAAKIERAVVFKFAELFTDPIFRELLRWTVLCVASSIKLGFGQCVAYGLGAESGECG